MSDGLPYKWKAMVTVSIGIFIATVDASIVNISLPTITATFGTDVATVEWVVMAYLLTITTLLLTLGRAADIYGQRKMYSTGFLVFIAGSFLCGLSLSPYQLIASRILQGVGAATLIALGSAIVTDAFPSKERGKALGIAGSVVAVGIMTGPVLGGFIIQLASWRWIFYINVPIGVIGSYMALRILKKDENLVRKRFDVLGALVIFVSLACLMLALNQGENMGWASVPVVLLFAVFALTMALFIAHERKHPEPVLELKHFRNRLFSASLFAALISFMVMVTVTIRMPFFLDGVLHYEPYQMGLMLTAMPLALSSVASFSGALSDRIGYRFLTTLGLSIVVAGLLLMSTLSTSSTALDVFLRLALLGIGLGIFQSPNNSAVMGCLPRECLGMGSGMLATMRNIGSSLGIALSGAIISTRLAFYSPAQNQASAFVSSLHDLYIVSAVICVLGVLVSFSRGDSRPANAEKEEKAKK